MEQRDDRTHDDAAGEERVDHHVDLDADLDDVWAALTDTEQLAEWLGGEVALDVRPTGTGHVVDVDGTVREVLVTDVDPGRRVAWHWWSDRDGLSSVELTVERIGDATRLRVVEVLVPSGETGRRLTACTRRWERATSALWQRLGASAVVR